VDGEVEGNKPEPKRKEIATGGLLHGAAEKR